MSISEAARKQQAKPWFDIRDCFQKPEDLLFLALGVYQLWSYFKRRIINDSSINAALSAPDGYMVIEFSEAFFAVLIAACVVLSRRPCEKGLPLIPYPLMLLLGGASLYTGLGFAAVNTIALVVSMVICAFVQVWCYMSCIYVLSKLDAKRIAVYILLSYSVSSLLRFPLEILPAMVTGILVVPFPMLCTIMCNKAEKVLKEMPSEKIVKRTAKDTPTSYVLIIVTFGLAVGSCCLEIAATSFETITILGMYLVQFLVPLLMLALLLFMRQNVNVAYVCQLMFILILSVIVLVTISSDGFKEVISIASYLSRYFIRMFFLVTITILIAQSDTHPLTFFGLSYGVLYFSMAGGTLASQTMFEGSETNATTYLVIVFAMVIAMVVAVSMEMARKSDSYLFVSPNTTEQILSQRDLIEKKCSKLAKKTGLTQREEEVIFLIALGRSKRYIAEHLIISDNTVRGYARQAYKKLDIHSKQDLLDLLEL